MFFIHGTAMAMWFVPLATVLDAYGLHQIRPYAFATNAAAAIVSPLFFGSLADRRWAPVQVLRALSFLASGAVALATIGIQLRWNAWLVLALVQIHAFITAPTWSLSNTIVLGRLADARRQFGPVRVAATVGWLVGCLIVSALHADESVVAGYGSSLVWIVLATFTLFLPSVQPVRSNAPLTARERLGLDALSLLRNRDHRVVFVTAALTALPMAAFYPYTPPYLKELGFRHTTAWMSLGQITEVLAQYALAWLLSNWRLKWIFFGGLSFALLRYACFMVGTSGWTIAGISMHGLAFTLFFVTAPIYLNERVDGAWRARAQALMYLMTSGLGNLAGYLLAGWWYLLWEGPGGVRWTWFWAGLATIVALVMIYFVSTYHGQKGRAAREGT